jgi:hypothetical protein
MKPLQENPHLKEAWLRDAREGYPVGTRVRIQESDVPEYLGMTGSVGGYDIGMDGDWPLIRIVFDRAAGGVYHDGFYESELVIINNKGEQNEAKE